MNNEFLKIIEQMYSVDQEARFNSTDKFLIYTLDIVHGFKIKDLIEIYGYPNQNTIGIEGLRKFWLLIQHQDLDLELQKTALEKCNFLPNEYAHLFDRINVNSQVDQKYGTQLNKKIKNIVETNNHRKEIGLESIKDYVEKFNSENQNRKLSLRINEDGSAEYVLHKDF